MKFKLIWQETHEKDIEVDSYEEAVAAFYANDRKESDQLLEAQEIVPVREVAEDNGG